MVTHHSLLGLASALSFKNALSRTHLVLMTPSDSLVALFQRSLLRRPEDSTPQPWFVPSPCAIGANGYTRFRSALREIGGKRVSSPLFNYGCTDLEKVADWVGDRVSFFGHGKISISVFPPSTAPACGCIYSIHSFHKARIAIRNWLCSKSHDDLLTHPRRDAVEAPELRPRPRIFDHRHTPGWRTQCAAELFPVIVDSIVGHGDMARSVRERYGQINDQELIKAINLMTIDHGKTEIWVSTPK